MPFHTTLFEYAFELWSLLDNTFRQSFSIIFLINLIIFVIVVHRCDYSVISAYGEHVVYVVIRVWYLTASCPSFLTLTGIILWHTWHILSQLSVIFRIRQLIFWQYLFFSWPSSSFIPDSIPGEVVSFTIDELQIVECNTWMDDDGFTVKLSFVRLADDHPGLYLAACLEKWCRLLLTNHQLFSKKTEHTTMILLWTCLSSD